MRIWGLCALVVFLCVCVVFAGGEPAEPVSALSADSNSKTKWILIEIHRKTLTLYQGTDIVKVYPVATGTSATPSPIGTFRITNRFTSEMSGFGTRFLGLNVPWGTYGIHGTNKPNSISSNASHGCIRMYVKDAEDLYNRVPNGTKVVIEGGPYGDLDTSLKSLSPGDRNSHVKAVQGRLKALGYYWGYPDGIYGEGTKQAVLRARKALGLKESDSVDWAFYQAIDLILFE